MSHRFLTTKLILLGVKKEARSRNSGAGKRVGDAKST